MILKELEYTLPEMLSQENPDQLVAAEQLKAVTGFKDDPIEFPSDVRNLLGRPDDLFPGSGDALAPISGGSAFPSSTGGGGYGAAGSRGDVQYNAGDGTFSASSQFSYRPTQRRLFLGDPASSVVPSPSQIDYETIINAGSVFNSSSHNSFVVEVGDYNEGIIGGWNVLRNYGSPLPSRWENVFYISQTTQTREVDVFMLGTDFSYSSVLLEVRATSHREGYRASFIVRGLFGWTGLTASRIGPYQEVAIFEESPGDVSLTDFDIPASGPVAITLDTTGVPSFTNTWTIHTIAIFNNVAE